VPEKKKKENVLRTSVTGEDTRGKAITANFQGPPRAFHPLTFKSIATEGSSCLAITHFRERNGGILLNRVARYLPHRDDYPPSKIAFFLKISRSSSATRLSLPPTLFSRRYLRFARRADRKSIYLRAKRGTRNRFSQSYAAGQFPITIPPGCRGSPPVAPPREPHPDDGSRHVREKRRRHRCGGGAILHRVVISLALSADSRGGGRKKRKYRRGDHVVAAARRRRELPVDSEKRHPIVAITSLRAARIAKIARNRGDRRAISREVAKRGKN